MPADLRKLNKRVVLKKYTRLVASKGQVLEMWGCCRGADAAIEALGGAELLEAQQTDPRITTRITALDEGGDAVMPRWKVVWQMRAWSVLTVSVLQDGRSKLLILHCVEV